MKRIKAKLVGVLLVGVVVVHAAPAQITVTQPSDDTRVAAGVDFATQEFNDPWDMDRIEDVFLPNSVEIVGETVSDGIYSFETINTSLANNRSRAQFWMIHPGLQNAQRLVDMDRNPDTNRLLFRRIKRPIDTSVYRYLSLKIRMSSSTASPLSGSQQLLAFYFEDESSIADGSFGFSPPVPISPDTWTTVVIDLYGPDNSSSSFEWRDFAAVEGLRIDPTNNADVFVEVDWIRLTAEPDVEQMANIAWQGNGSSTYTIDAVLDAGTSREDRLTLATTAGSSVTVSLAELPTGSYQIEVSGGGDTDVGGGAVLVNDVPAIQFDKPDIKGHQELAYGAVETGNPWTVLDRDDFGDILDFEFFSFSDPSGSLTGRPIGSTSRALFNVMTPIDTAFYRALCYEFTISGLRDIELGSVTKVLWGNKRAELTTPVPVITQDGLNEYCVGDMMELTIDDASPPNAENEWSGFVQNIRIDPHEFPRTTECMNNPNPVDCRDIRLDSFILAPFYSANPEFTFEWNDSDADDNATILLFLDPDKVPDSGNEISVAMVTENGVDSFDWTVPAAVEAGQYNVYAEIDDGLNRVVSYATGPLVVGQRGMTGITIQEPDGISDFLVVPSEYGLTERGDPYDMTESSDINFSRAAGISNLTIQNGILSGSNAGNNPQLTIMTTSDGDPAINANQYRFLSAKVRVTGADETHFVQVFYSPDADSPSDNRGFTSGEAVIAGEWEIVTFDLVNDESGSSTVDWAGTIRNLRLDPTNKANSSFEIDWITLSPGPSSATNFDVQWTPSELGSATINVLIQDSAGDQFQVAEGLPGDSSDLTVDFSSYPLGDYLIVLDTEPGPDFTSPGTLSIVAEPPVDPMTIFADGFESD